MVKRYTNSFSSYKVQQLLTTFYLNFDHREWKNPHSLSPSPSGHHRRSMNENGRVGGKVSETEGRIGYCTSPYPRLLRHSGVEPNEVTPHIRGLSNSQKFKRVLMEVRWVDDSRSLSNCRDPGKVKIFSTWSHERGEKVHTVGIC